MQPVEEKQLKPANPWIRWSGGKRWAKDLIIEFWNENKREYFSETFGGGIAATLACRPEKALINDINPHLINMYRQVQNGLSVNIAMENNKDLYQIHRALFNDLIEKQEALTPVGAQLFYYLNKTGFNGLCRFNRKGLYNVPFGQLNNVNYINDFALEKELIKNYQFTCGDFIDSGFDEYGDSVFHFIDSPYHGTFSDYSQEGFTWDDQVRTIEWAGKLKGPVLLTNKATPEILELLKENGFEYKIVYKTHTVGASADSRKRVGEVFAWRNMRVPEKYPLDKNWRQIMSGKLKDKK